MRYVRSLADASRFPLTFFGASVPLLFVFVACGSESASDVSFPPVDLGDASVEDAPSGDVTKPLDDGGFVGPDGEVIRSDRFITKVVSFTPGECAGFGASSMPEVVMGPPVGSGSLSGSLDVVSLGVGGEIVVSFEPNAIVDGPGPDFIVFENAFYAAGDPNQPAAELGEVSVSEDGVTWKTFECEPKASPPYGLCAGWTPVYSSPANDISPLDPATAGGEAYDLAELDLELVRFVRIRDKSTAPCEGQPKPTTMGFDLDAISLVNAADP